MGYSELAQRLFEKMTFFLVDLLFLVMPPGGGGGLGASSSDDEDTGDTSTAPGASAASAFAYQKITAERTLPAAFDASELSRMATSTSLSLHTPPLTFWKLWTGSASTSS